MNNNMMEQVELESLLDTNSNFQSSVVPRWKRKSSKPLNDGDRFIPRRSAMDMDSATFRVNSDENREPTTNEEYRANVAQSLGLPASDANSRVLAFKHKPVKKPEHEQFNKTFGRNMAAKAPMSRSTRHIPSLPTRVLDAPDMQNDYYLNLLSWSVNNTLAVALGQVVYLWNCSTGSVEELMSLPEDCEDTITSVSWMREGGNHLAIGTTQNTVQLWDATRGAQVRTMGGHAARIGSLAWNGCMLASGSRDSTIMNHDIRVQHHHVATMRGHSQEVCGLTWSPDGRTLASGGNDNTVCLWDSAQSGAGVAGSGLASTAHALKPRMKLAGHTAAAKALAWSPHERNVLASGGGTGDRSIKLWNTASTSSSAALMNSIDTGSQVSSLVWNPNQRELLSGHGYSENQLTLWNYPTMTRIAELKGHTERVLHVAAAPDGSSVASAGADETLRFWNVFGEASGKGGRGGRGGKGSGLAAGGSLMSARQIR